jgi:type IV pilus assembly protein PilY1
LDRCFEKEKMTIRIHLSTALAALTLGLSADALAQGDVERPLPNVLFLVDTSGSMEFKSSGDVLPRCTPANPTQTNEKSRWIDLVEVMTGTFENYSCFQQDRSTAAFRNEFSLSNTLPYDLDYALPFTRPLSGSCVVGPGVLPSTPYDFPDKSVNTFSFTSPSTVVRPGNLSTHNGCANFSQAADGVMDVFKQKVRFALMTFDTHTGAGTGVSGTSADYTTGTEGTWSYYLGSPTTGRPAQCLTNQSQEVGARNAAAPPWEGRMVAFGPPTATGADIDRRNAYMQQVLLASRPYGATPIAGLLDDAKQFLWNDTTKDPLDAATVPADFGPRNDAYTKASECRRNIVILLSDGEPNLDLRPYCENTAENGRCPYQRPEEIAWDLYHNPPNDPDQYAEVYVIGFALSRVSPTGSPEIGCAELRTEHCTQNPNDRAIQACCTLNKIAAAGGKPNTDGSARQAYFPQNRVELRRAISAILGDVTTTLTTRTAAAFSSNAGNGGFQFSSGFAPILEKPWQGKLTRTRIECDDGEPVERDFDAFKGDDFAANVSSGAGPARQFYAFVPSSDARNSVRPFNSVTTDGITNTGGAMTSALSATQMVSSVPATVTRVGPQDCESRNTQACHDAILGFTLGVTNSEGETRCRTPGSPDCSLLGAIYHSTPKVVAGRPAEFLRDESYEQFTLAQQAAARPTVLYTASIDGLLHAFKVAPQRDIAEQRVARKENNELWAFLPPAVFPVLRAQYPITPASLLDGVPTVKDVVSIDADGPFERDAADAQNGAGTWRTVLAMGFGTGQVEGGYFALDVTNPVPSAGGPRFLWQLTRDANGKPLFGVGGTPLITTVFIKTSTTDPGREVPVAVLPGGNLGSRTGLETDAGPLMATTEAQFASATQVNEYAGSAEAQSLTIVRLDNGRILRTFRNVAPTSQIAAGVTTLVTIPAPITGQAAAYPSAAGSVADRIFVGDREGRIWRIDVSKNDPAEWTMNVFFDAYFDQPRTARQPIELAPVLSVDEVGQITVAAATGEQQVQTAAAGMLNRVFSLTETLNASRQFEAEVNWVTTLGCPDACAAGQQRGERVTGPLSLFGSAVYYATSTPLEALGGLCGTGTSRVWGVHYTQSLDEFNAVQNPNPMNGPVGAFPDADGEGDPPMTTDPEPGLIFGVSIENQPTCSGTFDDFTDDPYLGGYGQHTAMSGINPGGFFLVYQVGGVTSSTAAKPATTKMALKTPRNSVFIDSWAPIFE